jgi:hypothetical protein
MSVDRHRDRLGHDLGSRVLDRDPGIHDLVVVRRFAVGTVAVAVLAFVGCRVGILGIHHDHDLVDSPDSRVLVLVRVQIWTDTLPYVERRCSKNTSLTVRPLSELEMRSQCEEISWIYRFDDLLYECSFNPLYLSEEAGCFVVSFLQCCRHGTGRAGRDLKKTWKDRSQKRKLSNGGILGITDDEGKVPVSSIAEIRKNTLRIGFDLFEHLAEGVGTRLSLNLGEFRVFEEGIPVVDAAGEYHFDNH